MIVICAIGFVPDGRPTAAWEINVENRGKSQRVLLLETKYPRCLYHHTSGLDIEKARLI